MDTVFVVYCAGPHGNDAANTALRLARLGRPVKIMIGARPVGPTRGIACNERGDRLTMQQGDERRIGFVTFTGNPAITGDDALVRAHLPAGATLEPVVWDAAGERDDHGLDLIVLRSCWNYHRHGARFLEWLTSLDEAGVRILNPPALIRWNAEKTYLRPLADAGCSVTPTHWLKRDEAADLNAVLEEEGWQRAVVKPTVSASSFQTWVVDRDEPGLHDAALAAVLAHSGAMIQPFLDEINDHGEWSLMFFDGAFSHAVLKQPQQGEFRVQEEFGGSSTRHDPPPGLIRDALAVIDALPESPAYARIDGIERDGGLLLIEAELIEPALFLGQDPEAPARFAATLTRCLGLNGA